MEYYIYIYDNMMRLLPIDNLILLSFLIIFLVMLNK